MLLVKVFFGRNAEKHDLKLPIDGGMLQSDDLNGDGKEDILIKYGKQDDKTLANQFRVFIASEHSFLREELWLLSRLACDGCCRGKS